MLVYLRSHSTHVYIMLPYGSNNINSITLSILMSGCKQISTKCFERKTLNQLSVTYQCSSVMCTGLKETVIVPITIHTRRGQMKEDTL